MSFITHSYDSTTYAPGWFLANDEQCVRKTQEISASDARVKTIEGGGKYMPMGSIWPSNDSSAVGIVYEDVDVTNGNMPGSVVMSGTVYEDRLPVTGAQYDAVTLKNLVSPQAQGWQERSGEVGSYTYANSTDTTVNTSKTYYLADEEHTEVTDYAAVLNPVEEGWYESDGGTGYVLSTDTEGDKTKTYYEKSDVRMSDNAKTALAALGFEFITTAPAVVRP